jgi:tetratricopeptide (TPR) repeat protein
MFNLFRTMRGLWPAAAALAMASPAAAQSGCTLNKVLEIPVALVGGRPMVQVSVDGHQLTFLVDSAATYSTIDPATAKALDLPVGPGPNRLYINGVGGNANPRETHVKDFHVAGVGLTINMGKRAFLVMATGGAPGSLGKDMLGASGVEYDLPHGAIRLFKPTGCRDAELAYWADGKPFTTVPIDPDAGVTESAVLNGARIKVTFSTGAQVSVLTTRAAAKAKVKPGDEGVKTAGSLNGAGSHQIQVWRGPFASFRLGDEEIKNVELQFGDVNLSGSDMLLGDDFFLSHRVFVSSEQNKAYITYEGGPLFGRTVQAAISPGAQGAPATTASAAPATPAEPEDADGAYRAATVLMTQGNREGAITEFSRAMALAPNNPKYAFERARARIANRQPALAMADLDKVLSLTPAAEAYFLRAQLRISERDNAGAVQDIDAASRTAPETSDLHMGLGDLDGNAGRYEPAVSEYSRWISAHPNDSRMAHALFGRCRARALIGSDLEKALDDCNRSLGLAPNTMGTLQSRAIVRFKLGDADRSIADYDASLKAQPKDALALYGRGLAKLKKGLDSEGQADIAAATILQPRIADQAKALGLAKATP